MEQLRFRFGSMVKAFITYESDSPELFLYTRFSKNSDVSPFLIRDNVQTHVPCESDRLEKTSDVRRVTRSKSLARHVANVRLYQQTCIGECISETLLRCPVKLPQCALS